MKNDPDIPTTDRTEIERLIERVKQGKLNRTAEDWDTWRGRASPRPLVCGLQPRAGTSPAPTGVSTRCPNLVRPDLDQADTQLIEKLLRFLLTLLNLTRAKNMTMGRLRDVLFGIKKKLAKKDQAAKDESRKPETDSSMKDSVDPNFITTAPKEQ